MEGAVAEVLHRPLQRSMGSVGALLLTLSIITPALSVFGIGSQVIAQAGTGAVLAFILAAIVCVPVALAYAELSSAFPLTGAEYTFLGRVLGPSWGFMALGLNISSGALTQAFTGLVLADYLGVVIPGTPHLGTALAAVGLATLTAVLNIRTNAVVTGIFLATEIAALTAVSVLGFSDSHRSVMQAVVHPVFASGGALLPASIPLTLSATVVAVYAYNGFGSAVSFGEELHDAPRKIAAVVLWALVIGCLCEAVPIAAVIAGAPDLKANLGAASPVSAFISAGGGLFAKTVSLGVAAAVVNAMIATSLSNARQLYATGRDGAWPGSVNRAFATTHRRFHSPWVATVVSGLLAAAACFLGPRLLVIITATGIIMIYAGVCASVLVGRRTASTDHGHYKAPAHPASPIFALVSMGGMVVADLFSSENRISLAVTLAIMLAFAAYYRLYIRRRGVWRLRGATGEALEKAC